MNLATVLERKGNYACGAKGSCAVFAALETLRLHPDHLDEALEIFKREYGCAPAVLGIAKHRHNQAIIGEARRRGITMIHEPKGMLAFEIWMYPDLPGAETPYRDVPTEGRFLATMKKAPLHSCQKSGVVYQGGSAVSSPPAALGTGSKTARGRPRSNIPVGEIKKLSEQGFGAKAISGQLKAKGYSVSFRTLHRILTGERQ